MSAKRVVVVGGGVIGLCSAWYLARKGFAVTVLDREGADHEGCSYGNAGLVTPSHIVPLSSPGVVGQGMRWLLDAESPFFVKPRFEAALLRWGRLFMRNSTAAHVRRAAPILRDLNLASRAEYAMLADALGEDFGLTQLGCLMLAKSRHALDHELAVAEHARSLGVDARALSRDEAAAMEPDVRMDIHGAVHYPPDCHLVPARFMGALRRRLGEGGVTLRWGTAVTGWRRTGRRIDAARTAAGDVEADAFVIASGSWSPVVARGLDVRLPMQAGKGYSLTLTNPPQLPRLSAICMEARVAVTPMDGALRFAGTMELAGLDTRINPARVRGIVKSVARYYPEFTAATFDGVTPWAGLRPCSPDGLPFLGRATGHDNLVVAAGHAMLGLSLGPITGKLVAEILAGEPPSVALDMLAPDRYR